MGKRTLYLMILVLVVLPLNGQDLKKSQEAFMEAEYFMVYGDYSDALPYYLRLYEQFPDNSNIAYRIGTCYLNTTGKKNLSIKYLEEAVTNMSAKYKEGALAQKSAPYEALYSLALSYRVNYQFVKAKEAFTRYKETLLDDDLENISFIDQQIATCDNAVKLMAKPVQFREENMGPLFNDEKSNFNPICSPDGKFFAFMTSLKFYDAVMFSKNVNGKWSAPVNITPEIQLDGDLFISCLSADGKLLLLSKDDDFNSDIYFSTFDGTKWTKAREMNKNINTRYWESHGFVNEDQTILIFASDRPGGFGGLDLYISRKDQKGEWGPAVNLGPEVNTQFNEDRPFLLNNGKTLFFASQGHSSMGGFDIFQSNLQTNNLWSKPENIGYPLNYT